MTIHVEGAFLGSTDLKLLVLGRIRDRSRGPLPPPRLTELCHAVAARELLPGVGNTTLGWPEDLLALIDTLAMAQHSNAASAFVEQIVVSTRPGAALDDLPPAFMARLLGDPREGAISRADGDAATLLHALADHLELWRDGGSLSSDHWQSLVVDADALLARAGNAAEAPWLHYSALLARSILDFDAANAARWMCQLAAARAAHDPIAATHQCSDWQVRLLLDIIQDSEVEEPTLSVASA